MTRLYRAVSEAEFLAIRETGVLQITPGSLEGKWFAESAAHALQWGDLLGGIYRLIVVEFPDEIGESLFRIELLDQIGPARFADVLQLGSATIVEEVVK